MCLIMYVPPKGFLPQDFLPTIYDNNPHGFGMMWVEDRKVKHIKGLFSPEEISYMIGEGPKVGVAYHWRYATRGITGEDQCHPFMIADDFGIMHNGTIHKIAPDEIKSDTEIFTNACQRIWAKEGTDYFFTEEMIDNVEDLIESNNKMLFMGVNSENGKRRIRLINREKWTCITKNGKAVYLSNTYSLVPGYRDKPKVVKTNQNTQTKRKNLNDYLYARA